MKTKIILAACVIIMTTAGFDCINSPLIVALNAPITGCVAVNTGNGSFNGSSSAISIIGSIPSDYQNKLAALRISDIRVSVSGAYPSGVVSGTGYFKFNNANPEYTLLTFNGQYSAFAAGVSVLNSGGLITINPAGLSALLSAISNVNTLPSTITLRGQGSGPAVTQSFNLCLNISLQADANAN
ncbi:MAG: hypothetical protein ABI623_00055 [bacterium]